MKKVVLALLVLTLLMAPLAACNGGDTGGGQTSAPPSASPESSPPPAEKDLVGISMPTRTVERWIVEGDMMKAQLEAAGFRVDLQYANDQVMDQVAQIENMITNGAKALIICPIDGTSLSTPLAKAKSQGAYVLSYDRLIEETADVDFYVGFYSLIIGNHMGRSLMTGIGADSASASDPLYIELFAGSLDDSETKWYFNGAMEIIQPYLDSGAVVVKSGQITLEQVATPGWDGLVAQNRMQNLLSAHYTDATLAGALSPYDGLSLGIIGALKAVGYGGAGRPMPKVTGQDCELPSLISIWNDEQYSSIFLDLDALTKLAVDVIVAALSGNPKTPDRAYNNGVVDVKAFNAEAAELTKENLREYFIDRGTYTEDDLKLS